eukprot:gene18945-24753_t
MNELNENEYDLPRVGQGRGRGRGVPLLPAGLWESFNDSENNPSKEVDINNININNFEDNDYENDNSIKNEDSNNSNSFNESSSRPMSFGSTRNRNGGFTKEFGNKKGLIKDAKGSDWNCLKCENLNWSWRSHCNKCNTAKPKPILASNEARDGYGGGFMERQDRASKASLEVDEEGYDDFGRRAKKTLIDKKIKEEAALKRLKQNYGFLMLESVDEDLQLGDSSDNKTTTTNNHESTKSNNHDNKMDNKKDDKLESELKSIKRKSIDDEKSHDNKRDDSRREYTGRKDDDRRKDDRRNDDKRNSDKREDRRYNDNRSDDRRKDSKYEDKSMPNLARKNRMGQNLNKMLKLFPKEYAFYPKTWVLPGEIADFRQQFDNFGNSIGNKIFIIKPDTGCQGRGIFLTKSFDNIPQNENVVAQVYMKKPLLIDGFKFDLRLYCLVSSVKPLRMYLFQDGLVRMCTEEYVKPNKQNINNVCMHLTNYAVNKRNANFQQPSAKSSEENQDEGSKRSLKWFMSYIAQEKGEAKAEWLWRRMGTLCVRSVLSIIPTLSREYDQHFKSFNNIPVNPSDIETINNDDSTKTNQRAKSASKSNSDLSNEHGSTSSEEEDSESSKDTQSKTNYPNIRGSRCFEVLGFDVMIDSNLKPWIIEVNHLPSFGTDSPLDYDIKDRLMKQVLPSVAVLPDDEQTYSSFQKSEAAKRLTARQVVKDQNPVGPSNKKMSTSNKPIKPVKKTFTKLDRLKAKRMKLKTELIPSHLMVEPMDTGICLPERFEEIKSILIEIYSQFSVDKVSKIDRLLAKYQSREEEFLKYVYSKYGITPPWILMRERYQLQQQELLALETEIMILSTNSNNINNNSNINNTKESSNDLKSQSSDVSSSDIDRKSTLTSRETHQESGRNSTRSLSPPTSRSTSMPSQKPIASWKMAPEEESNYRNEVLSIHYPKEDDEWLSHESKILNQFTRIFPPENSIIIKSDKQDDDAIDMKEDDDNDDDVTSTMQTIGNSNKEDEVKTTVNSITASYEDIIFQVFLQDKRQTQRLICPLPSRVRPISENDSQSLPPLDTTRTSFINGAKGIVGWKQPPPNDKKDIIKVPTASQIEAATRLSQGLSVSETQKKHRSQSNYQPKFIPTAFVMDPRVYIDIKPNVIFVLGGPGAGKGTQCEMLSNEYDGFPRNWDNVQGWEEMMSNVCNIETVLFIDCPEDILESRLLNRGLTSGRSDDNIEAAKKRFLTFQQSTLPVEGLVKGFDFHKQFFDEVDSYTSISTMVDPNIKVLGKSAVITYIRNKKIIDENKQEINRVITQETRIWNLIDGQWKQIHFHRNII